LIGSCSTTRRSGQIVFKLAESHWVPERAVGNEEGGRLLHPRLPLYRTMRRCDRLRYSAPRRSIRPGQRGSAALGIKARNANNCVARGAHRPPLRQCPWRGMCGGNWASRLDALVATGAAAGSSRCPARYCGWRGHSCRYLAGRAFWSSVMLQRWAV
jgi:hypothetical protein